METNVLTKNNRVAVRYEDRIFPGKIKEIYEDSVKVVDLETGDLKVVPGDSVSGLDLNENYVIKAGFQIKPDGKYINLIFPDPEKSDFFYSISLTKFPDTWELTVKDSKYLVICTGFVKTLHELQNLIKFSTNQELHVNL